MKLRGNCPAKVDEKGRLKIPDVFLDELKEYGNQFYITSTTGETARIYPMKVWSEIEDKLAQTPSTNRAKRKFLMRTSYYGQTVELDGREDCCCRPCCAKRRKPREMWTSLGIWI